MADNRLVSIVVLSWNTKTETETCLDSLRKLSYKNKEVIVVDNGSTDGSKDYLSRQEDIIYIDLPKNTGFTGGQIEAYKYAKGDYIALINNDAVVAADWIEQGLSVFKKDPKVAAVGGRAYLWNDEFKAYNTNNPFYSYQVVDPNRAYAETLMTGGDIVEVNSISGAGVIISKRAIQKVGYFDNRFFAYYEETDLFARMKRQGYKIIYNPKIHTWHKIAQSTKDKPYFYLYQMHKNRYLFAYKNFDQDNLKVFKEHYQKEFVSSSKRAVTGKGTLDDKARINAYIWNKKHLLKTKRDRKIVQAKGSSYTKLLLNDACQNVSIVIPCYNYGPYVKKAIQSALNQTQKPLEVIVINDGSTDNSKEEILKFKDSIILVDKINEGVIVAKNIGLEKAKGSWIIFLDADDYLINNYIEKCLIKARQSGSDIVYTDMKLFGAKNEIFTANKHSKRQIRRGNYIHNSALLNTSKVREVGGYKQEMAGGYEDWELYLSLVENGAKAEWINEPLLFYRQHNENSRNVLAQEKSEKLLNKAMELHPKLFNIKYKLENKTTGILVWAHPKKKYIKIFWPPTWVRKTRQNSKRISILKKDKAKQEKLKQKLLKSKKMAKRIKVRSMILEIKNARRYYQNLDKGEKKRGSNGKNNN